MVLVVLHGKLKVKVLDDEQVQSERKRRLPAAMHRSRHAPAVLVPVSIFNSKRTWVKHSTMLYREDEGVESEKRRVARELTKPANQPI